MRVGYLEGLPPILGVLFDVERWHTRPHMGRQTTGHHTARMMYLTWALVEQPREQLLFHILIHDISEFKTGDIPSPFKNQMPEEFQKYLHETEAHTMASIGIEDMPELEEYEVWVMAFVDSLECLCYSMDSLAGGNKRALEPIRNSRAACQTLLDDYQPQWPQDIYERASTLLEGVPTK